MEKVAVVTLDTYVRKPSRTVFAEEEQIAGPTVRDTNAPAEVELVAPPAQPDTKIVEGTLGKAVAVHLRAVTRRRSAGHVGRAQVLPATSYYVGSSCYDAPP